MMILPAFPEEKVEASKDDLLPSETELAALIWIVPAFPCPDVEVLIPARLDKESGVAESQYELCDRHVLAGA
ncbi:hypothetical protein [Fischerella thermalis]|uniref:hypothetical protein n=1 Tax=Fischerella thermalis TaxID=372787 RepID=UPI00307F0C3D